MEIGPWQVVELVNLLEAKRWQMGLNYLIFFKLLC